MSEKIIKPPTYIVIFIALMVLTGITLYVSRQSISEEWHTIIGLSIAIVKASLVILFFMHIWYSSRLTWVIAGSSLIWLAIFIFLTLNDYLTRAWSSTLAP